MIVIGGIYSEYCYHPEWHQIFGSGGRGAAALTRLGDKDVVLHSPIAKEHLSAVQANLVPYGIEIASYDSDVLYEFSYTHPLSNPSLRPIVPLQLALLGEIKGELVLAYGMLEAEFKVTAERVIYDPQSEADTKKPSEFIKASDIALIANEAEIRALAKTGDAIEGARALIAAKEASLVVVKQGPFGSTLVLADNTYLIPAFPTRNVFKIGSGDIFSAAFSKFWGADRLSPLEAAQNASRCAALYCDNKSVDAISEYATFSDAPREKRKDPKVYLAGPFFSLAQRILIEEARQSFESLGINFFSPMHEVGFLGPSRTSADIAKEDLVALDNCNVVFAAISDLDPGTIFEVGYARAKNIPVVVYAEGVKEEHLTMLVGSE